jgi:hypothetical protein
VNSSLFPFSRNLNLLVEDDLLTFFYELTRAGYPLPVSNQADLKQVINFARGFLPDSAFRIEGGMSPIHVRPKMAVVYNFLRDILPIIHFLYTFRTDNDFIVKIKTNLLNLPQFDDTLFELSCLKRFYENGFSFEYEPSIRAIHNEKKPDFRLTKNDVELFLSCKQVRFEESKPALRFNTQCGQITGGISRTVQDELFVKKLRLEINFKGTPSTKELDQLIESVNEMASSRRGITELPPSSTGNVEYLVVPQSQPGEFPVKALRHSLLKITDIPRGLSPDVSKPLDEEITIYSTDLTRRRRKTLSKRIREAKNQLPDDKLGIIVIGKVSLHVAIKPIQTRMNGTSYENIIAFVVNPFEDFWYCYRMHFREVLADLFQGFQPVIPFLSD